MKIAIRAGETPESFGFSGKQEMDLGPEYQLAEPADVQGKGVAAGENTFILSGIMRLYLLGSCARCSEPADYCMDIAFEERFEREATDDEAYLYGGDTIDMAQALTDNAFLNLPGRLLCQEGCKGLCPVCGHNLNEGECGCRVESENPFEVLWRLELPAEDE